MGLSHNCVFIVGFRMEPGEDGDPIRCDKPAGMQIDGLWYCAEHFDEVEDYQQHQGKSLLEDYQRTRAQAPISFNQVLSYQGLSKHKALAAMYGAKSGILPEPAASKSA
jgi:hypothetical protein